MPLVRDVLRVLDGVAPSHFAYDFDHIGLQVGELDAEVKRAAVCLDYGEHAQQCQPDLVIAHHPIIWDPLSELTPRATHGAHLLRLVRSNTALIACHTNWDCALGGINCTLASLLELRNVAPEGPGQKREQFKLIALASEAMLEELVSLGACEGASPVSGSPDKQERIELVVPGHLRGAVEQVLSSHGADCEWVPLAPSPGMPIMRTGEIETPCSLADFARFVQKKLGYPVEAWGEPSGSVRKVGLIGGAAGEGWRDALNAGCDVFLTGEIPHHHTILAVNSGIAVIQAGHFATENPGMRALRDVLATRLPEIEWVFTEPSLGISGRPIEIKW